ncbi:hypothetical protein SCLARK_00644 [Spiroplasma clarkii]|nr:hypothetical protein [Spiroplasma clarkii]ARU91307.1 hypothetical protein SCLARK_00644 [Spiroplasma clarkii]
MSKVIIAARHENLNFNVNELLSSLITPEATLMRMPQSYEYEGKNININGALSNYKKLLAPTIATLDQDHYAGTFASYIMGMYDDDFYKTIINGERSFNDTMNQDGDVGFNKADKNALGYLAGLNKDLSLASSDSRRSLAWGIQDTGALTNYLLKQGFDGGNPGDTRARWGGLIGNPGSGADVNKGGTNGGGYAFYNSLMAIGSSAYNIPVKDKTVKTKLANLDPKITYTAGGTSAAASKINDISFNEMGATIAKSGQSNNVNGGIALFASMAENLSTTASGALTTAEFTNYLLPVLITDIGADGFLQSLSFTLLTNIWKSFNEISKTTDESLVNLFGIEAINEMEKLDAAPVPNSSTSNESVKRDQIGYDVLYKWAPKDQENPGTNAQIIVDLVNKLAEKYANADSTQIEELNTKLFYGYDGAISNQYKNFIDDKGNVFAPGIGMGLENWNNLIKSDEGLGGINLLQLGQGAYEMALDENLQKQVEKVHTEFGGREMAFRNLTSSEKQKFLQLLGYNGSGFEKDSYLGRTYSGFTDESVIGQKQFAMLFKSMKNVVNSGMKDVHEKAFQYIYDDQYWTTSESKVIGTSNLDLNGSLEFTLKYTGIGDKSSNASSQHAKVVVPENFNPYQTILKNQTKLLPEASQPREGALSKIDTSRKSGVVLGVEQNVVKTDDDLIKYDGVGLLNNYDKVDFEYKVKWENISNDQSNPYWVITGIDCFNNGQQFYNIY